MNELLWEIGPFLIVAILILIAWFVLRFKPANIASPGEFDQRLAEGRPLVVKFFANT